MNIKPCIGVEPLNLILLELNNAEVDEYLIAIDVKTYRGKLQRYCLAETPRKVRDLDVQDQVAWAATRLAHRLTCILAYNLLHFLDVIRC